MKLIKTISKDDFGLSVKKKPLSYGERESARAVVLNDRGEVYLLSVSTKDYHKLPGGGIEQNEDKEQALLREILEETGCKARIIGELGKIVEIRDFFNTEQTSFCYLAKQYGDIVPQNLDEYEKSEGHDLIVAKSINDAIGILKNDKPTDIEGKYIVLRDLTLLEESKKLLSQSR